MMQARLLSLAAAVAVLSAAALALTENAAGANAYDGAFQVAMQTEADEAQPNTAPARPSAPRPATEPQPPEEDAAGAYIGGGTGGIWKMTDRPAPDADRNADDGDDADADRTTSPDAQRPDAPRRNR